MGAITSKNMISNTTSETSENPNPDVQNLITPTEIEAQFHQLYLHSRKALNAINKNSNEDLTGKMGNMIKRNKEQLSENFDEAIAHREEIGELVRPRLTPRSDVYNIPCVNIDDVNSYICFKTYLFENFAHTKRSDQSENKSANKPNIPTSPYQSSEENGDGIDIIYYLWE